MSCFVYPCCFEYPSPHVCETVPLAPYPSGHRRWSDDEIASIRTVLHRLTVLRVRNNDDAEDLVQETLLTATHKCPEGDLEKGLLVWSLAILRRKVGNYYKRAKRFERLEREEWEPSGHGLPRLAPQESRLRHRELRAIIRVLLESFPAAERKPLELLIKGLPTADIAKALSPERYQNVANRLHRGRKKLARKLARYGYRLKG